MLIFFQECQQFIEQIKQSIFSTNIVMMEIVREGLSKVKCSGYLRGTPQTIEVYAQLPFFLEYEITCRFLFFIQYKYLIFFPLLL